MAVAGLGCEGAGRCASVASDCTTATGGTVCGCDGVTYDTDCAAGRAGVASNYHGGCDTAACGPQDARGEGTCGRDVGWTWNGAACVALMGCNCAGADCAQGVWQDQGECQRAHAYCP